MVSILDKDYKMTKELGEYATDKIGLASFLVVRNIRLLRAEVKNRNRATFIFEEADAQEIKDLEQDYLCSDSARFYEAFKHLRELCIKGATK